MSTISGLEGESMQIIEVSIADDGYGLVWVAEFSDMPSLGPLPTPFTAIMDVDTVIAEIAEMNPNHVVRERG